MADRLTELVPAPRTVRLGGRDFPVWEARISDLAALQGYVDARQPHPLEGLESLPIGNDLEPDPARDRLLFLAHDRACEGGPAFDSEEGSAAFATPEGFVFLLQTALSRGTPGLTEGDIAAVLEDATPEQYAALRRAFFGADDARTIERLLGLPAPDSSAGGLLSWGEAIDDLARSHGWTYPDVYALTLTEFGNARRRGRRDESGFRGPPAVLAALHERLKAAGLGGSGG